MKCYCHNYFHLENLDGDENTYDLHHLDCILVSTDIGYRPQDNTKSEFFAVSIYLLIILLVFSIMQDPTSICRVANIFHLSHLIN